MKEPILVPEFLNCAMQQRFMESNGLLHLIAFSLSPNHDYIIPQEKINTLFKEYFKTWAEINILRGKIQKHIPKEIGISASWVLDFYTNELVIDGYTEKTLRETTLFKTEPYNDSLNKIFNSIYPGLKTTEVTFQVTENCTLACKYCYQHDKTPKIMTFDVAKKFIDTLFNQCQETHFCLVLDFIGGEPLMQPQLISDIIDYWDYKCIMENLLWGKLSRFSICSNGTEYRTEPVQKLLRKIGNRLSFTVSIDGNKELHDSARVFHNGKGSYDVAIDAATDFENKYKVDLGSKMTIAPSNIIFLYPAVKHYLNNGKKEIFANCVFEEGWTYEDASLFYKELKKVADYKLENYMDTYLSLFEEDFFTPMDEDDNQNWCGGNGLMLAADPDGVLYPCLRYMPSSIGDKQEILTCGHVDTGIDISLLEEMQKITRRSQSTDECFYCPIAKGCSWCTAYNYEVFGTINKRATFICPMHKARALANVYYWNKYYRINNIDKRLPNYCPREWALEIINEDEYNMLNELALG